ncbi:unnamed protein product [Adineta ricciae]|uniref:Uncharacterized protein n=2 Tax=Adineta ricciae TaxID=249248 RepID=A0A814TZ69_ADIRI|nr:unnamed protein product [Adineta ricciae]
MDRNAKNRRKNGRNANRKKQETKTDENHVQQEREKDVSATEAVNDKEQESMVEQSDSESREKDFTNVQQSENTAIHVEDEQQPMTFVKQRSKQKLSDKPSTTPSGKEESVVPIKPQASVAPVKQTPSSTQHSKPSQDNHLKTNGYSPIPYNLYTYSAFNPLPPRFQQQRQQKEAELSAQKFRKRQGRVPSKRSSLPPGSAARPNEFVPSSPQQMDQQEQQVPQYVNNQQTSAYVYPCEPQQHQHQQESSMNHDYSSESDVVTDSPLPGASNSLSPIYSTSVGSESSLQRLDLVRSLTASHGVLDELMSILDTAAFSSDELDLILTKIASRHNSTKADIQRLLSVTKSEKTLERILDETYRSQAKILAIELQTEKTRVFELTKSNGEMENTIRQLQQQPTNVVQYQQMILSYQMQIQRLADENARLQQQLHAYSMLPAAINDMKQQQHILTEKIRQMTIKNTALQNEVAENERASKHAAEIYKKADSQKQERLEQMIADINKYRKLDKELTNLRQKHSELEKTSNTKIEEIVEQRDELKKNCEDLRSQIHQCEQIKAKYDQLMKNQSNKSLIKLQDELNDMKAQNDQLRQRNWKIMEELNKLLNEQRQTQDIQS